MTPVRLVVLMSTFLGLTLLGMHAMAALLPEFIARWELTNTEAGWLSGSLYLSYLFVVPFLTITDRVDAKRILIAGAICNAVGYAGFGLFADGLWSGLGFRAMQGIGFAFTYMPGVKAISDRVDQAHVTRSSSLYMASFPACSSLSILLAGLVADDFGWRWAFVLPGVSNLAAALLIAAMLPPAIPKRPEGPRTGLLDFRPVLRNRRALGFIVGSGAHTMQLLAVRTWTVTFLTYAIAADPGAWPGWNLPLVATILILLGVPTGMLGGELAGRYGAARVCAIAMIASGIVAATVGFGLGLPLMLLFWGPVVVHNLLVLVHSGALGGGAVAASDPQLRGATMALFAVGNGLGGFVGPVLFGAVLDLSGGGQSIVGWGLAFAGIGVVVAIGGLVVYLMSSRQAGDR